MELDKVALSDEERRIIGLLKANYAVHETYELAVEDYENGNRGKTSASFPIPNRCKRELASLSNPQIISAVEKVIASKDGVGQGYASIIHRPGWFMPGLYTITVSIIT